VQPEDRCARGGSRIPCSLGSKRARGDWGHLCIVFDLVYERVVCEVVHFVSCIVAIERTHTTLKRGRHTSWSWSKVLMAANADGIER